MCDIRVLCRRRRTRRRFDPPELFAEKRSMTVCWRGKNKFSKFVFISMLWIFLIFALSGCNTVPLAGSGAPIGASGPTPTAEPARENLRLISAQGGPIFTGISGTKNGGYEIFAHTDATADIIYYDYQTLQKYIFPVLPTRRIMKTARHILTM